MSDRVAQSRPLTVEEYLALDERSDVRLEYVAGEVYAMTEPTTRHNFLVGNVAMRLRLAARGGPCRVYSENVKLRTPHDEFYFPDVMVDCTPGTPPDRQLTTPCLLVEVTSPSTRRTDRHQKLESCRRIPTLRGYLVVEQYRRRVTHHRRRADGSWEAREVAEGETIELDCPRATLTLGEIDEDITMPPLGVAEPEGEWG